jgi:hypothetical protein
MGGSNHDRRASNAALLALCCGIAACGGGGGGSSSSSGGGPGPTPPPNRGFTVSATSINQSASVAGDEPLHATLLVTVTDPVRGEHGIRATYTSSGISSAHRTTMSTTTTELSMGFKSPHQINPGVYQDTIRIGLCEDAACSIFRGTPLDIPVTYTVTVGTLPTVAPASNTVTLSRLPWDSFTPPPMRVNVTATPRTRYHLSATVAHTSDAITSASYAQDNGDFGYVQIAFKPATQLSPGVHTDTITLSACIDQACAYPLVVSPSVITVTYNVTPTMPGPQGYSVRRSAQAVADIIWSESRDALYGAVPAQSPNYPSNVIVIDPVTETVGSSAAVGFDPSLLALSDDESMLYVSERNGDAIRRFTTAPLGTDVLISLGNDPYPPGTEELFAADMRVAPGQPHVLAVRRNANLSGREGLGIVIYDDAVRRPEVAQISPFSDWGNIAWDPDGTRLYSQRAVLTVTANGPVFASNLPGTYGRLHYENGLIYADEGQVVDPAAGTFTWFSTNGRARALAVDVASNRAYFATHAFSNEAPYVEVFNLLTRERVGEAMLPPFATNARATRIVRYGVDGLAIVNSANELYLVQGPLIQ